MECFWNMISSTIAQYAGEGGMFSLGVTTCVVSLKIVGNLDEIKDIGVVFRNTEMI